jgi:hypothetical protein
MGIYVYISRNKACFKIGYTEPKLSYEPSPFLIFSLTWRLLYLPIVLIQQMLNFTHRCIYEFRMAPKINNSNSIIFVIEIRCFSVP